MSDHDERTMSMCGLPLREVHGRRLTDKEWQELQEWTFGIAMVFVDKSLPFPAEAESWRDKNA